jgi:hypothetical protein
VTRPITVDEEEAIPIVEVDVFIKVTREDKVKVHDLLPGIANILGS